MNKLLLAIVLVMISSLCAVAQSTDHDWSGFYIGGNIFASRDQVSGADGTFQINQITNIFVTGRGIVVVPGTTRPQTGSGTATKWGGGGHVGYLWQSGHLVIGPEFEFDPSHRSVTILDTATLPATAITPPGAVGTLSNEHRFSQDMFFRGRVGYAFGKSLIYGTGGYANSKVRINATGTFTAPAGIAPPVCAPGPNPCFNAGAEGPVVTTGTAEQRKGGWTVGGGFDQAIGKHLSVGAEYRHTDLGDDGNFTFGSFTTVNTGPEVRGDNGQTGSLGSVVPSAPVQKMRQDTVNFRFAWHF